MRALRTALACVAFLACSHLSAQDSIRDGDVTVLFPPGRGTQARATLALYRRAQGHIRSVTGLADPGIVTIELARSDLAFESAYRRVAGGPPTEHALAVAFTPQNRILVRTSHLSAVGSGSLPETLVHETFHIYLGSLMRRRSVQVPLWFNEGVAQWVARQNLEPDTLNMLQTRARGNSLIPLASLAERFPEEVDLSTLAYAQSLSFIEWNEERRPGTVRRILSALAGGQDFDSALRGSTGGDLRSLEAAWRSTIAGRHSFFRTFFSQLTLFSLLSIVAIAAYVRYRVKRKRTHRKLEEDDLLDGYAD
jgi:hypothetical protein